MKSGRAHDHFRIGRRAAARECVFLKADGCYWEVIAGFEPMLRPLLKAAVLESKGTPVKRIERRQVGNRTFFIKRLLHGERALRPLKYFFKNPRSRREWRNAGRLERAGVPVVARIAHGERWSFRGMLESILITEAAPGFVTFEPARDAVSREAQGALGSFIRILHDAGCFHHDLHASNLLFSRTANSFRLVDFDKLSMRGPLDRRSRILSLASLASFVPLEDRFFEAYGSASPEFIDTVFRESKLARRALIIEEGARCLPPRHHSDFPTVRCEDLEWVVRKSFLDDELRQVLRDPDAFFVSDARLLKRGRSAAIAAAHGFVIKRYDFHGLRRLVRNNARESRARRAFRKAYLLELAGIPTAGPIACAERRRMGLIVRGYFITREIPGASSLRATARDRGAVARAIGAMLARMHNEGFSHRDTQASNILVDPESRVYLIDMEGLRYEKSVPDTRAVADLSRLARDLRDRRTPLRALDAARLLHAYCRARGMRDARWWYEHLAPIWAAGPPHRHQAIKTSAARARGSML